MDPLFWQRLHGGSTHLPIVLFLASVALDAAAWCSRDEGRRAALHAAGLASTVAGVLGGCAAAATGLVMTHGETLGSGPEKFHHLFVWPAFSLGLGLTVWRLFRGRRISRRGFGVYLGGMAIAGVLMLGAGYWGGEMLLAPGAGDRGVASGDDQKRWIAGGHKLFLMNCAHCHGDDARGTGEAPDLSVLRKSDARIASIVQNGIKGEMPRFGQKLHDEDIRELISFLHSLQPSRQVLQSAAVPNRSRERTVP